MLALNGFDVWGLEVCDQAVRMANETVGSQLADPSDDNFGASKTRFQPGKAQVVLGDFFQHDWESQTTSAPGSFDLIYDYTVSCPGSGKAVESFSNER
jgi:hypothetical protein